MSFCIVSCRNKRARYRSCSLSSGSSLKLSAGTSSAKRTYGRARTVVKGSKTQAASLKEEEFGSNQLEVSFVHDVCFVRPEVRSTKPRILNDMHEPGQDHSTSCTRIVGTWIRAVFRERLASMKSSRRAGSASMLAVRGTAGQPHLKRKRTELVTPGSHPWLTISSGTFILCGQFAQFSAPVLPANRTQRRAIKLQGRRVYLKSQGYAALY